MLGFADLQIRAPRERRARLDEVGRVELLAASVRRDELSDPEGAITLYQRLFGAEGVPAATMLEVCRRLDALLSLALVLDDPERRERLTEASLRRAPAFDLMTVADRYEEVYRGR